MSDVNPLTQVHDALWQLLEDRTEFTDLVPKGNRIKATPAIRNPDKEKMTPQDFPQVRIMAMGVSPHLWSTSCSSKLTVAWEVQIATDQQELCVIHELVWVVFQAFHNWVTTLKPLTWNDKVFVITCVPGEVSLGQSEAALAVGVKGWSAVWIGATIMTFTSSDLQGS